MHSSADFLALMILVYLGVHAFWYMVEGMTKAATETRGLLVFYDNQIVAGMRVAFVTIVIGIAVLLIARPYG